MALLGASGGEDDEADEIGCLVDALRASAPRTPSERLRLATVDFLRRPDVGSLVAALGLSKEQVLAKANDAYYRGLSTVEKRRPELRGLYKLEDFNARVIFSTCEELLVLTKAFTASRCHMVRREHIRVRLDGLNVDAARDAAVLTTLRVQGSAADMHGLLQAWVCASQPLLLPKVQRGLVVALLHLAFSRLVSHHLREERVFLRPVGKRKR